MGGGRLSKMGLFRCLSLDLLTAAVCIALSVSFLLPGTNGGGVNGVCFTCHGGGSTLAMLKQTFSGSRHSEDRSFECSSTSNILDSRFMWSMLAFKCFVLL